MHSAFNLLVFLKFFYERAICCLEEYHLGVAIIIIIIVIVFIMALTPICFLKRLLLAQLFPLNFKSVEEELHVSVFVVVVVELPQAPEDDPQKR